MIADAYGVPRGTVLEADLCIIGGGPAGISLALAFDSCPLRIVLLEAGGLTRDHIGQSLYKGESVGLHYDDLDQSRSRYFGGSSNCWGGFSRPLDQHDFETREWVPNSGWPISRDDLEPYYRRAQAILQLGPFDYDAGKWEAWIGRRDVCLLPLGAGRAVNRIAQISPPVRFGHCYRDDLSQSGNVTVYLNANVTEVHTPGMVAEVTAVTVRTLAGVSFLVTAKTYIVAAGGLETPRLLLASNSYQPTGVGNHYDVVGRYFMDHPRLRTGTIRFRNPRTNSGIYDMHIAYSGAIRAHGVKTSAYLGLTTETLRAERMGSTRCYVRSRYAGDGERTYAAVNHLRMAMRERNSLWERSAADLLNIAGQVPNLALLAAGLKLRVPFLARGFDTEIVTEPTPLPDSRVTLGTERDRLGMPRIRVDWRLGELEKRTILRTQAILEEELAATGAASLHPDVDMPAGGGEWPTGLNGCWHHMGTTRMHTDPRQGVVDANCRVHGVNNLYIAGSSVFPTAGADMPTLTIVALALRLAEHIKALRQINTATPP